ncbi:MAG: hypothetical protein GXP31_03035 [Kiritimatiellaeota bacterium]|nr:hypothetical protein [Kiritimatiellota bacterium]
MSPNRWSMKGTAPWAGHDAAISQIWFGTPFRIKGWVLRQDWEARLRRTNWVVVLIRVRPGECAVPISHNTATTYATDMCARIGLWILNW